MQHCCGVIVLHLARISAGIFAVPVFLTFLGTRVWLGGTQSSIRPGHHQTSARPCLDMRSCLFLQTPRGIRCSVLHVSSSLLASCIWCHILNVFLEVTALKFLPWESDIFAENLKGACAYSLYQVFMAYLVLCRYLFHLSWRVLAYALQHLPIYYMYF